MKHFLTLALLILPLALFASADDLSKSKGTDQDVIIQLAPLPAQKDVSRNAKIEVTFTVPLDTSAIQEHNIKLTYLSLQTNDHIEGTISYSQTDKKLTFTPKASLEPGMYEVEIKSLKADKDHKETKIKEIKYRFVVVPTLTSINLESNAAALNVGEKTELTVTATYSDNSTKELTSNIEWISTPVESVEINGTTLTVMKDVDTALQAKVGSIISNTLNLELYWEVNGHTLPPEPDKTINDSTLLGIDINNNDVRDDVERWIYKEYKDKHPIHIDIAMQAGRAYKLVLETPERAKEIHNKVSAALSCEAYYQIYAKYLNESLLVSKDIVTKYFRKSIYFNTIKRKNAYNQYDTLLSGDTYTIPKIEEKKSLCDFDINKYEE